MSRIACIGSRQTPPDILTCRERVGAQIVGAGHIIVTGNASGADQAWARGGNSVDPTRVELCLPWQGFEHQAIVQGNVVRVFTDGADQQYRALAAAVHPRWTSLSTGSKKLHSRNVMIVIDTARVFYYLWKRSSSGTRFGVDVAIHRYIPTVNVGDPDVRASIEISGVNGAHP